MARSGLLAVFTVFMLILAILGLSLILMRRHIEGMLRQLRKRPEGRRSKRFTTLKRLSSLIVVSVLFTFIGFSVNAGLLIDNVRQSGKEDLDQEDTDTKVKPDEVSDGTEVSDGAESPPPNKLPASTVTSVDGLTKGYFKLSAIHSSDMLELYGKLVSESDEISVDTLEISEDRLISYLEELCSYGHFLNYHNGLKDAFPRGDRVDYGFEDPEGIEDCLAELRGAGEELKNCVNNTSGKKAALRHIIVRGKDCLYYGKPLLESAQVTSEQMWAFAELTFTSIVNRIVCGGLTDAERSHLYYIAGQVFQYLSEIADTDELRHHMNYVATIFFRCACNAYLKSDDKSSGAEYANEAFFNELKSIYNIAITLEGEQREPFFEQMRWAEDHIDPSLSTPGCYAQMRKEINEIALYAQWREKNES